MQPDLKQLYASCGYDTREGLRKLESITDEELKGLNKLNNDHWDVKTLSKPSVYEPNFTPSQFIYLISKGFELFSK